MLTKLRKRIRAEAGVAATEYALTAFFVAIAIVVSVALFGQALSNTFNAVGNQVAAVSP